MQFLSLYKTNKNLTRFMVPVSCFFNRMAKSFKLWNNKFRNTFAPFLSQGQGAHGNTQYMYTVFSISYNPFHYKKYKTFKKPQRIKSQKSSVGDPDPDP